MSDSDDSTQINIRITRSKKQEWETALEEHETLSAVIKTAVDKEINDEYAHVSVIDELYDAGDNSANTEEITNEIDELRLTVQTLTNQIQSLQTTQPTTHDDDESESIEDIAHDIIQSIPTYASDVPRSAQDQFEEYDARKKIRKVIEATRNGEMRGVDGSPERIAAKHDKPVHRIREALNYIEHETTENVKSAILDDGRHWMRL